MFAIGLIAAGPAFLWAFPLVLIGQLMVCGVFGNLVSKWPLQGSVYAWSRELIGPRYGWFTGWAPNATAYAASKAGLIALTKGLGRELGPQGILTNAIAPSFIDTSQLLVDASDAGLTLDEMRRVYAEQIPVRRLASPDDIAAAVAFLAGPGSSAVVGQILQPSGGVTRTRA